jgi:hypothetical protein
MKNTNELIEAIQNCEDCYGQGVTGWVSPDGDYDFEWCDCNPYKITLSEIK